MGNQPHTTSFLNGNAVGLATTYAFPLAAGAVLAIGLVHVAVRSQWGDQTWLLFAAQRAWQWPWNGFDSIAESNPPLVIWLSMIPVAIAHLLDIRPVAALQACLAVLVACSVVWSTVLVSRSVAPDSRRFAAWFALVLIFATSVHPWLHYGQREHILLLLVLPYLIMAAARLEGQVPSTGSAIVAGLCAGVGFLLKPYHLIIVVAVELLLLLRARRLRSLYRPEPVTMIATGLSYVAAMWLWTPDYLSKVLPLALSTYNAYHHVELWAVMPPMRLLKIGLMVLLWAVLYRYLARRALATVLVLAGVGATIAYVLPQKGHEYHFVPAMGFFDLLLGLMAIDCCLRWAGRRAFGIPSRVPALASAVLMFVVTIAIVYPLQLGRAANAYTDSRIAVQRAISHDIPRNSTVLILSTSAEAFFEQVLEFGWEWGSRFMCLWMVPGLIDDERSASLDRATHVSSLADFAALTRQAVAGDLARWRPNPVLVDRCQDHSIAPCMGETQWIDLLAWLDRGREFAKVWSNYEWEGTVGPYDLWCLKGATTVCDRILKDPLAIKGAPGSEAPLDGATL